MPRMSFSSSVKLPYFFEKACCHIRPSHNSIPSRLHSFSITEPSALPVHLRLFLHKQKIRILGTIILMPPTSCIFETDISGKRVIFPIIEGILFRRWPTIQSILNFFSRLSTLALILRSGSMWLALHRFNNSMVCSFSLTVPLRMIWPALFICFLLIFIYDRIK